MKDSATPHDNPADHSTGFDAEPLMKIQIGKYLRSGVIRKSQRVTYCQRDESGIGESRFAAAG
jgi:hypothetical protein